MFPEHVNIQEPGIGFSVKDAPSGIIGSLRVCKDNKSKRWNLLLLLSFFYACKPSANCACVVPLTDGHSWSPR